MKYKYAYISNDGQNYKVAMADFLSRTNMSIAEIEKYGDRLPEIIIHHTIRHTPYCTTIIYTEVELVSDDVKKEQYDKGFADGIESYKNKLNSFIRFGME